MSFAARPRYWIPGLDTWSLAAPVLFAVVVVALVFLPKPSGPVAPSGSAMPVPRPLSPTVIATPKSGSVFRVGAVGDLLGTAEPGGYVRLYHGTQMLGQTVAAVDGRYGFRLGNFQVGQHSLRVETMVGTRSAWSDEIVITVEAAPKPTAPKRSAPAKRRSR